MDKLSTVLLTQGKADPRFPMTLPTFQSAADREEWWNFGPTPRVGLTTRAVSLELTHTSLRAVLRRIPVTRVADLTPLDRLALPVFSAVTPLAGDLTTHLG